MDRWVNQEEAYQFAMKHPAVMLAMDMGTGKTRVAIDVSLDRQDVSKVLVVCPKAVLSVWESELTKHSDGREYRVFTRNPKNNVAAVANRMVEFLTATSDYGRSVTRYVVINYDSVWRSTLGAAVLKANFDMVVLDESHRAKAAGSKVSKFLALLGRHVKYRMCLTGTPMANSPLDVYGQYRFLDPSIYGTNHARFLDMYAVMGGAERRFVVGFKNQVDLNNKFKSIAYSCSMKDVAQRLKLPAQLPPTVREVILPHQDMQTMKTLAKEFIAECSSGGTIVLNNVLTRTLRMLQISAGFCMTQQKPSDPVTLDDLNTVKEDALKDYLEDLGQDERVVVFCVFQHDLDVVRRAALSMDRHPYELSGRENTLREWKETPGAVIAVQIQAGAEGVDMTASSYAVYFTLPYSLALYNQSKARLYRPGQTRPVSFMHLIATNTMDELIYNALQNKQDLIEGIKNGTINYGVLKR